jgi:thiosulfate/3-mercaptopyruvate sulfurtransferase
MTRPLVSAAWLHDYYHDDDVKIVDASWFLPNQKRDGHAEYLQGHIPGAVYFPIDDIADKSNPLPHMLPTADQFADAAGKLGIQASDRIVVYDSIGLFSAARVWWTFLVFGAKNVNVLEGGLPAWRTSNYPIESEAYTPEPTRFIANFDPKSVSNHDDVKQALTSGDRLVIDARSNERFRGIAPEPRPELPSGHMPGAYNVPFGELIGENGRLVSDSRIRDVFKKTGVDLSKPITTSCGSGVTAAILSLALHSIGHGNLSLYDGSWTEWASRKDCPRESEKQ